MKPMLDSFGRQKTEEDLMNLFKLINGMRYFPVSTAPTPNSPVAHYSLLLRQTELRRSRRNFLALAFV